MSEAEQVPQNAKAAIRADNFFIVCVLLYVLNAIDSLFISEWVTNFSNR